MLKLTLSCCDCENKLESTCLKADALIGRARDLGWEDCLHYSHKCPSCVMADLQDALNRARPLNGLAAENASEPATAWVNGKWVPVVRASELAERAEDTKEEAVNVDFITSLGRLIRGFQIP
jgi:hypothetical protein